MELVWENGGVNIRGPLSSRTQWTASCTIPFSCSSESQQNTGGDINQKKSRFGTPELPMVPPGRRVSGINSKIDTFLKNLSDDSKDDYQPPQLSPQLSQANLKAYPENNNTAIINKNGRIIDFRNPSLQDISNTKQGNESRCAENNSQLLGSKSGHPASNSRNLQQRRGSGHCIKWRGQEFLCSTPDTTQLNVSPGSSQNPSSMGGLPGSRTQEENPGQNKKMDRMNFSHFSRPVATVRNSIPSTSARKPTASPGFSNPERFINSDKMSSPVQRNPRPIRINSAGSPETLAAEVNTRPSAAKLIEPPSHRQTKGGVRAVAIDEEKSHDQAPNRSLSHQASAAKGKPENEKYVEPFAASSSACSQGASNQPQYTIKRKHQETKEPADHDSDVAEGEPQHVKKTMPARDGIGAKKIRAVEVHNVSEKRRRDRINKRMRALQQLIPNCKKLDKASVLDETIEYLRTLQFQLQIMSVIRTGMYVPPIMLTPSMTYMNAQHLAHCSRMGTGMGGLTVGMGVGSNPTEFTSSPISGITTLPGMGGGTTLQMAGLPSQVQPTFLPRTPFTTLPNGQQLTNSAAIDLSRVVDQLSGFAPLSRVNGPAQNINTSN